MKSVLFYSFKGGVGRTQTMINIAKHLSEKEGKKIAIIDFDIYAPGISYLATFGGDKEGKDYLLGYLLNLFNKKYTELYYEQLDKNLYIIPAAQTNNLNEYHKILTELSPYLYSVKLSVDDRITTNETLADSIYRYIFKSIEKMNLDLDYVFYDSRTGITEVSDILFSNELDLKVIVSSFNSQNINGTNGILKILANQKGPKHNILRILSPKPIDAQEDTFKEIKARANLDIGKEFTDLKENFNWHGTHDICYDKRIVSNDNDVWNEFSDDCTYKNQIITISNIIEKVCYEDNSIDMIIEQIEDEK